MGFKIEEADFAVTLLTSLPDSWESFIGAVDISTLSAKTASGNWTWSTSNTKALVSRIMEEARRWKQKAGDDVALYVKDRKFKKSHSNGKRKPSPDHNDGNCFICN